MLENTYQSSGRLHWVMLYHKLLHVMYSLLTYMALPIVLVRLAVKGMKAPAYYKRIPERLGFTGFQSLGKAIWIHAVSVGEVLAAVPLIQALQRTYPNLDIVVTTTTPTGSEILLHKLNGSIYHSYLPYDLPGPVDRFLNSVQPLATIIMETEIWPNLFLSCSRKSIPVIMANARISPTSCKRYQNIKSFISPVLNSCHMILAQSKIDAERFLRLEVDPHRLMVTGNLKFDLDLSEEHKHKGERLRYELGKNRRVWIAASTHAGEEEQVLKAHSKLLKKYPDALLILVPRHPERFVAVAALCSQTGLPFRRRTQTSVPEQEASVYLGDTMGELPLLYAASDMAFVGGSLTNVGGHNLLEPASLSLPIVTGPYLLNCSEIADKLETNNALIKIQDGKQLAETLACLFQDQQSAAAMGEKALKVVHENKGALLQSLDRVQTILNDKLNTPSPRSSEDMKWPKPAISALSTQQRK